MPLISYIIASYNVPVEMLTACIDSILATDLADEERQVIVVDDGSDVPCADVLKGYSDRVTVIRQENQGLSVARNTGMEHADGEYMHFVDADDMLVRQPYNRCLEVLKRERPDVLAFDFTTSNVFSIKEFKCFESGAAFMLAHNLHVAACTYIVRKSTLKELRFVPQLKNEDERFSTSFFIEAGKTIVTGSEAYFYRQREGSLQHSYDEAFIRKRLDDYAATMLIFNKMTFDDDTKRKAMQRRVHQMVMDYIYNTIVLTRSKTILDEAVGMLKENGLYPLPHRRYTAKYFFFSFMANCTIGRALLLRVLPMMPKEV